MITGASQAPRISRQVSTPPMPGMFMSRSTKSGRSLRSDSRASSPVFSAIELVKNHSLLEIIDARAAVGNAGGYGVARKFSGNGNGLLFGRVEIGVFDQLNERFFRALEIGPHRGKAVSYADVDAAPGQRALAMRQRGVNDVLDRCWSEIERHLSRFQLGHLASFFDKVIQAVALLIDDRQEFVGLWGIELGGCQKTRHRGLHRGQRSAKVMRDGIEQGGFQTFALLLRFSLA